MGHYIFIKLCDSDGIFYLNSLGHLPHIIGVFFVIVVGVCVCTRFRSLYLCAHSTSKVKPLAHENVKEFLLSRLLAR